MDWGGEATVVRDGDVAEEPDIGEGLFNYGCTDISYISDKKNLRTSHFSFDVPRIVSLSTRDNPAQKESSACSKS